MNGWQRLAELLEEMRKAIIQGDLERLQECVKEKEALLKDPSLRTPASRELLLKIRQRAERNQMLLKAGLAFIQEAYRFLSSQLVPEAGYTARGKLEGTAQARLISIQV